MNLKKKGNASFQVILFVSLLIYIFIPLFMALVQNGIAIHQKDRIEQTIEMSLIALIAENETTDFSKKNLTINKDPDDLKMDLFYRLNEINPQMLKVDLEDIFLVLVSNKATCSCGFENSHFMIYTDILAKINFLGSKNVLIHKHMEFPISN